MDKQIVAYSVLAILLLLYWNYHKNINGVRLKSASLWTDHALLTRDYLAAYFEKSRHVANAQDKLMQNQEDIGNFFGCYYGANIGSKVTSLLKQHILGAVEILHALDTSALNLKISAWHANGKEIGDALDAILSITGSADMMRKHLELTIAEVQSMHKKDSKQAAKDYEAVLNELMEMSDMIVDGIAKTNRITLCLSIKPPCCH